MPRVAASLRDAKDKLISAEKTAVEKTKQAAKVTDDYVHEHPWRAVGVAAAVGVLVGMLISRRRHGLAILLCRRAPGRRSRAGLGGNRLELFGIELQEELERQTCHLVWLLAVLFLADWRCCWLRYCCW